MEKAERFGQFLNFPTGHMDAWEAFLDTPEFAFSDYEYDDWPRGRILYDSEAKKFIVYHDLKVRPFLNQIVRLFSLPKRRTVFRRDHHYQSKESLSGL